MKKILIILIICIVSCKKEPFNDKQWDSNYVIFGQFYRFCSGEKCIEIYKLTENGLYEDVQDQYLNKPGLEYNGFAKLNDSLRQKVKNFPFSIPSDLYSLPDSTFGMPDAGDWGGNYLEVSRSGKKSVWYIDKMQSNLPEFLKPLATSIESNVAILSQ